MPQKFSSLPQHIGIIMDGNRRWARQHGLQVLQGHEHVSEQVIEPLVDHCIEVGVKYLTLWAFSTENWRREAQEVEGLMGLFRKAFQRNGQKLHEKGVKLQYIGDLSKFPQDIQDGIQKFVEMTKDNHNVTVTFALNYGGRDEIIRAVGKASAAGEEITEQTLVQYLDTAGMPDPDLIIRPGGEQRLSGFLPWQGVYAELYFTDVLMPDFSPTELDKALAEYAQRVRRFGS